jgi:hypothetical protein
MVTETCLLVQRNLANGGILRVSVGSQHVPDSQEEGDSWEQGPQFEGMGVGRTLGWP